MTLKTKEIVIFLMFPKHMWNYTLSFWNTIYNYIFVYVLYLHADYTLY